MSEMISRNNEIASDCKKIDDMINNGKTFLIDINERLDYLLEPTIPDLKQKYIDKNLNIDECDQLFDDANASCDNL